MEKDGRRRRKRKKIAAAAKPTRLLARLQRHLRLPHSRRAGRPGEGAPPPKTFLASLRRGNEERQLGRGDLVSETPKKRNEGRAGGNRKEREQKKTNAGAKEEITSS